MTDLDDDTTWTADPYGPDVTAAERADVVLAALWQDPDPVRRYRTIQFVADGLATARAVTIKQAEVEHGSITAAARALSITRQAIDETYRSHDLPGPRADQGRDTRPAYRYGQLLAACEAVAIAASERIQREWPVRQWEKLHYTASRDAGRWPAVHAALTQWLRRLPRGQAEQHRARVAELVDATTELSGHMPLAQQSDVMLGYHQARAASCEH